MKTLTAVCIDDPDITYTQDGEVFVLIDVVFDDDVRTSLVFTGSDAELVGNYARRYCVARFNVSDKLPSSSDYLKWLESFDFDDGDTITVGCNFTRIKLNDFGLLV